MALHQPTSPVAVLRRRAREQPDRTAYVFLRDGESDEERVSYAELDARASAIAARLSAFDVVSAPVLLLYPSGLEYIAAFFGCMYAGAIAVPAYPPEPARLKKTLPRLRAIATDSGARVVLTSVEVPALLAEIEPQAPELAALTWLCSTEQAVSARGFSVHEPALSELAFLQYTSGSTAAPKGVMVSHGNLAHNQMMMAHAFGNDAESIGVGWLPLYHDMGLIGNVLNPLYSGYPVILMSPFHFLQSPMRWLRAISRYRATISGGPNFAYDLCSLKFETKAKHEAGALDLSSWRVALNGAEPVRRETLTRFARVFAPCGFRRTSFFPCYGLAEATLIASGGHLAESDTSGTARAADGAAPSGPVCCGGSVVGQRLAIVDADRAVVCRDGEVGEIWLAGPHIAQGYWRRPEETRDTFGARLEGEQGAFLRTGDLGFTVAGELFPAGRKKDLIIVRGTNHYPQDIEQTVEKSHPSVRAGSVAAFSVPSAGEEGAAVALELRVAGRADSAEVIAVIRKRVLEHHDLALSAVALLRPGTLPKTSSGKLQRQAARRAFLDHELSLISEWRSAGVSPEVESGISSQSASEPKPVEERSPRAQSIVQWLVSAISRELGLAATGVRTDLPFAHYGVDSKLAVGISGALEQWLGRRLSPTLLYRYPTIDALAAHLAGEGEAVSPPLLLPAGGAQAREPIAIVGLGCRVPGGASPSELWELLVSGGDAVREIPPERFTRGQSSSNTSRSFTKAALVDEVDLFDPAFFGITASEARAMDPQQRLLLEVTWEALHSAGIAPDRLARTATGVFIGATGSDYAALRLRERPARLDGYATTGALVSTLAGRLSYWLGASGPSMVVDTACSSSLLAIHLACQGLRSGECTMALAGGVSLMLLPDVLAALAASGALAPDGRCKVFDAAADGYGRGEGAVVFVLKRLSDALAEHDPILALIRGSAVNQDGRTNGLTAPSTEAQKALIVAALANAGIGADSIDYIEAHGTGTPLGDPIELTALGEVFGGRPADARLPVGSIKTNIGHLEACAGAAGLAKVTLALHHELLPAHANLVSKTSQVVWDELPLTIPSQSLAWKRSAGRGRFAGVSSFGLTGTNVHVVVSEAPERDGALPSRALTILRLSAKDDASLRAVAGRHERELAANGAPWSAVCAAANGGQPELEESALFLAGSREELREHLRAFACGESVPSPRVLRASVDRPRARQVAFLFTGQGSQYPGMGRELYETEPVFRDALCACDAILRGLEVPLLDLLYGEPRDGARLDRTDVTQPALFALEYALAELWRSFGVEPDIVVGHSLGELVAACVAGAFPLEQGLRLAAARGALTEELTPIGAMALVEADEGLLREVLAVHAEDVVIAAFNAPRCVTIAGAPGAVEGAMNALQSSGARVRRLVGTRAFHSPAMSAAVEAFRDAASGVRAATLRIRMLSTMTGQAVGDGELSSEYWARQMQAPVRFAGAMEELTRVYPEAALVEIGPRPLLLGLHRRCSPERKSLRLPSLVPEVSDTEQVLRSVAALHLSGVPVRWNAVSGAARATPVFLPGYPWKKQRYWFEASDAPARPHPENAAVPLERAQVLRRIRALVAELIGTSPERVDVHTPLVELGADSILLIEGLQRIQQEFAIKLEPKDVFRAHASIDALAGHVAERAAPRPLPTLPVSPVRPAEAPANDEPKGTMDLQALAASLLTARQKAHLELLTAEYQRKTSSSKRHQVASRPALVDVRASAGFRTSFPDALRARWLHTKEIAYPVVAARSDGSRLWDLDGNEYVDFAMGFGVHLFGHGAPFLQDAIRRQLERGIQIGPQAELAGDAARLVCEITGVERVAFAGSGTEAVMTALRLARARTGRRTVALFAGSYHGSFDGVLGAIPLTLGSPPGIEQDVLVLEYGHPSALAALRERGSEIAAVLVEPVQSRRPELQPGQFLKELRALTRASNIALIFDEVLLGFRIHLAGAQAWFGVEADLVTYGKVLGGGMPIGAVAGRAEYMDFLDGGAWQYGDTSTPSRDQIWFAGTFNKNPLAMAASQAALEHLRGEGPALQQSLNRKTDALAVELNRFFSSRGVGAEVTHFGSLFRFRLPKNLELFYHHLIARGIYVWEGRSLFLSTAHSDSDIERLIDAVRSTTDALCADGFLTDSPRARSLSARRQTEPALRVFCLPDAGGNGQHFQRWAEALDGAVELVPLALPGRDGESPFVSQHAPDFPGLVRSLVSDLRERLDRPFALYGHSMGALLAFEIARLLRRERMPEPAMLFVSGEAAPQLAREKLPENWASLPDDALLFELSRVGVVPALCTDAALMRETLPLLRGDLALCASYRYADELPLSCPISAFAGRSDPLATKAEVAAWAEQSSGDFALRILPGDHAFARREWRALTGYIRSDAERLRRDQESRAPDALPPRSRPAA